MYEIVSSDGAWEFPGYERLVRKKQREYVGQNRPFATMEEDPEIGAWLENFHLWDAVNEEETASTRSSGTI